MSEVRYTYLNPPRNERLFFSEDLRFCLTAKIRMWYNPTPEPDPLGWQTHPGHKCSCILQRNVTMPPYRIAPTQRLCYRDLLGADQEYSVLLLGVAMAAEA